MAKSSKASTTKTKKTTAAAKKPAASRKKPVAVKKVAPKAAVISTKKTYQPTPLWVNLVAIALILLGYGVYRFWSIAKVNGVSISRLAHYQLMQQQAGEQILDNMITEALILDAAKQQNYVVDEQAIDDQIATIEAQLSSQGQTLDDALAAENVTLDEVKRQFKIQQIVESLGAGDTTVTDEEIAQYIVDNQDSIPEGIESADLNDMVRSQLENEKANTNISTWLEDLRSNAEIITY